MTDEKLIDEVYINALNVESQAASFYGAVQELRASIEKVIKEKNNVPSTNH